MSKIANDINLLGNSIENFRIHVATDADRPKIANKDGAMYWNQEDNSINIYSGVSNKWIKIKNNTLFEDGGIVPYDYASWPATNQVSITLGGANLKYNIDVYNANGDAVTCETKRTLSSGTTRITLNFKPAMAGYAIIGAA